MLLPVVGSTQKRPSQAIARQQHTSTLSWRIDQAQIAFRVGMLRGRKQSMRAALFRLQLTHDLENWEHDTKRKIAIKLIT